MKTARLFLLLICICNKGYAELVWNKNCLEAYAQVIKLNFKKGEQLIIQEKITHPNNNTVLYIESQIDFLKTFISAEDKDLEMLKERNEKRIKIISAEDKKNPNKLLFLGEFYAQLSATRFKHKEYIGAVYDIRKAHKYIEQNQKLFPDFKPNLKVLGLIHATVGSIPKNYSWAAGIVGLNGTINEGLEELRTLLQATYKKPEYSYLRDETIVLLTFLEVNLGKEKNIELMRQRFNTLENITDNQLLLFTKCVFHNSIAENDSVIELLSNRKQSTEAMKLDYLDYMEGTARLNNLEFDAQLKFTKYINNYKGKAFKYVSWQKIAWCKFLEGKVAEYQKIMKNCVPQNSSDLMTEEDEQANKDALSGIIPNPILLRSRLLYDGGYYNRAIVELARKSPDKFPTQKDKLELTYRMARIFDKQKKYDKAILFYNETLKNGNLQTYYFAANSALMLGQLYEELKDYANAEKYYLITLDLRNHEYQNSIDRKAKAGLNRIGK